jgi:hypothetical protein
MFTDRVQEYFEYESDCEDMNSIWEEAGVCNLCGAESGLDEGVCMFCRFLEQRGEVKHPNSIMCGFPKGKEDGTCSNCDNHLCNMIKID